jgi:hypothetical protein
MDAIQDKGSSSNEDAAPSYMLTNLVDATLAFQIVDIHQYMVESILMILQPSGPSDGMHILPGGKKFPARFFVPFCFPLYLKSVKGVSFV